MRRSLLLGCSILFLVSSSPSALAGVLNGPVPADGFNSAPPAAAPSAIPQDQVDSKSEFASCEGVGIGLVGGDAAALLVGTTYYAYKVRGITFGYLDSMGNNDIAQLDKIARMNGTLVSKKAEVVEANQALNEAREKSSQYQTSGELFLPRDPSMPSTQVPAYIPEMSHYMGLKGEILAANHTLDEIKTTFDQVHGGEEFNQRRIESLKATIATLRDPKMASGWSDVGATPESYERDLESAQQTFAQYLAQKTKAEEELTFAEHEMSGFKRDNPVMTEKILAFEAESNRLQTEAARLGGIAIEKSGELDSLLDEAKNKVYHETETMLKNTKSEKPLGVADDELRFSASLEKATGDLANVRSGLRSTTKCIVRANEAFIGLALINDLYRIARDHAKTATQSQSVGSLDATENVFNPDNSKNKSSANAGTQP